MQVFKGVWQDPLTHTAKVEQFADVLQGMTASLISFFKTCIVAKFGFRIQGELWSPRSPRYPIRQSPHVFKVRWQEFRLRPRQKELVAFWQDTVFSSERMTSWTCPSVVPPVPLRAPLTEGKKSR
jgi:hypothetical protein